MDAEKKRAQQRECMKRLYRKRKENHCCTRCDEQDERTLSGEIFCKQCYEKQFEYRAKVYKDRYQWYKGHKMCPRCGKQDAYTLGGRTYCYECAERERVRQGLTAYIDPLLFSAAKKDRKDYSKIPREQFAERGLCSVCGKPVKPGYKVCENCYDHLADMRSKRDSTRSKEVVNSMWSLIQAKRKWWTMRNERRQNEYSTGQAGANACEST